MDQAVFVHPAQEQKLLRLVRAHVQPSLVPMDMRKTTPVSFVQMANNPMVPMDVKLAHRVQREQVVFAQLAPITLWEMLPTQRAQAVRRDIHMIPMKINVIQTTGAEVILGMGHGTGIR